MSTPGFKGTPYRGGQKVGYRGTAEERFFRKVNKTDTCWLWIGAMVPGLAKGGYGCFNFNQKIQRAHRVSWQIHHGPIPEGMQVLHHCDVRHCVRPDHLFLGTHDNNMKDMARKGRARGSGPPGELAGPAKLKAVQVLEIRKLAKTTGLTQDEIANRFGVTQGAIHCILSGKTWKCLS